MRLFNRCSADFITGFVLILLAGASARADDSADAFDTYKNFIEARDSAKSLSDIYAFLPDAQVAQLKELPGETLQEIGKDVIGPSANKRFTIPDGDVRLVDHSLKDSAIKLNLSGEKVDGDIRQELRMTVQLVRENDGWKVDDPSPRSWQTVALMPVDWEMDSDLRPIGPGVATYDAATDVDASSFSLLTKLKIDDERAINNIAWDPRGGFVAVSSNQRIHLISLGGFEVAWSAVTNHGFVSPPSFRADGRALLFRGQRYNPTIIPLALNLSRQTKDNEFFYVKPSLSAVDEAVGGQSPSEGMAYHPTHNVAVITASGSDKDALAFIPAGDDLLTGDQPVKPLEIWDVAAYPDPAWAPDGSQLAWMSPAPVTGDAITISAYPGGKKIRDLSRPNLRPGPGLYSPDGKLFATTGNDQNEYLAVVWNVENGEVAGELLGISEVAFTPDGKKLLAVRGAGVVREPGLNDEILVWPLGAVEPEGKIAAFPKDEHGEIATITTMSISPNGRFLLAAAAIGREHFVKIWEIARD